LPENAVELFWLSKHLHIFKVNSFVVLIESDVDLDAFVEEAGNLVVGESANRVDPHHASDIVVTDKHCLDNVSIFDCTWPVGAHPIKSVEIVKICYKVFFLNSIFVLSFKSLHGRVQA